MSAHEWLDLAIRWTHLIAGIAWIGSSFYFIWLDRHLERLDPSGAHGNADPDLEGSIWMVHSGGFYRVERRKVGPGRMPRTLHWFKWEAAITWLSGVALLGLVYYSTRGLYLLDPAISKLGVGAAIAIGLGSLVVGWLVYDVLWSWGHGSREPIALAISLLLLVGLVVLLCSTLSGRAAFLHLGAVLGTIMTANVWMRILPAQQRMIDATTRGETPDFTLGETAKRRSVHNSYMTFPVLFAMLSSHFPGAYGG
ncbi:MAG: urate hydroxylase PuuD, partial [Candidatus Eiseniibacteriota bacterium]